MRRTHELGSDDYGRVAHAAQRLGMSEFELFEAAHREWHLGEASVREIERHFVQYLFHGTAPSWVRAYIRRSLPVAERSPGVGNPPLTAPRAVRGLAQEFAEGGRVLFQVTRAGYLAAHGVRASADRLLA